MAIWTGAGVGGEGEVSPELKTPAAKTKRANPAGVSNESAPKQPRRIKSQRSPTVHYSPSGGEAEDPPAEPEEPEVPEAPMAKLTAAKSKPKKSKKAVKEATPKPKAKAGAQSPKVETPSESTAKAVQQALARGTTADLAGSAKKKPSTATTTAHARSKSASSGDEGSESVAAAEAPDEDDTELTLEQVRAQKAARARYMRFSRSFKSKRYMSAFISIDV